MKRYYITLGSLTTANGIVISASSNGSVQEKAIALEGDIVSCPACQTVGIIQCVGPRVPGTWSEKLVALENDFCLCKCSPSPLLLASQFIFFQFINSNDSNSESLPKIYSLLFQIKSNQSGTPLAHVNYKISLENGKEIIGQTDSHGLTQVIISTEPSTAYLDVPYDNYDPSTDSSDDTDICCGDYY